MSSFPNPCPWLSLEWVHWCPHFTGSKTERRKDGQLGHGSTPFATHYKWRKSTTVECACVLKPSSFVIFPSILHILWPVEGHSGWREREGNFKGAMREENDITIERWNDRTRERKKEREREKEKERERKTERLSRNRYRHRWLMSQGIWPDGKYERPEEKKCSRRKWSSKSEGQTMTGEEEGGGGQRLKKKDNRMDDELCTWNTKNEF